MIFITGGAASGKTAFAQKEYKGYQIIDAYEKKVGEMLSKGLDPEIEVEAFISSVSSETVIIMRELGCGLVPIDKNERLYRECCGRVACILAANASRVIRLIAGIPQVIKE